MTKDSRNLEIVSDQEQVKKDMERRRLPRLNLAAEQFCLKENDKVYSVADLSKQGMALRVIEGGDLALLTAGRTVQGWLNLRREKFEITAQVKHVRADLVGLEFTVIPDATREALHEMLDPAMLGRELRPVPSSPDESHLWFHGPSGTDLMFWKNSSGNTLRMALHMFGTYIQWDMDEGLSTGKTFLSDEESEVRGAIRFETMLLDPDARPDPAKLETARELVSHASLPADLREWSLRRLDALPS